MVWGWVAALGIGGDTCVDRELDGWIDRAPVVEAARGELRAWLLGALLEQYEQRSGLSANTEAVEVAEEYWGPRVEPVVAERWTELRGPSIAWFEERLSCRRAWRLSRERTTLDAATSEAYALFWEEQLEEPTRAEALRDDVGELLEDWGDTFASQVRGVLPGPPNAGEP